MVKKNGFKEAGNVHYLYEYCKSDKNHEINFSRTKKIGPRPNQKVQIACSVVFLEYQLTKIGQGGSEKEARGNAARCCLKALKKICK